MWGESRTGPFSTTLLSQGLQSPLPPSVRYDSLK